MTDNKERYINPYTNFGFQDCIFRKVFEQAEIARYSESERRQYEESKKIFWDNSCRSALPSGPYNYPLIHVP